MQIVKSSTVTWVDVVSPTHKDVHKLMHDFNIHPLAATQLKNPTFQPTVEHYDQFLYIALHFPIFNRERGVSEGVEIDFIITPSLVLTNRYVHIEALDSLLKKCSFVPQKSTSDCLDRGPFFLFYSIVNEMFKFSRKELDTIHEEITDIENALFDGKEKDMVPRISHIRRDIINFLGALKPQRMVLETLEGSGDYVDRHTKAYIANLLHQYDRLLHLIDTKREMIEALQATNESLLNVKINEVMKTLTIMAFVTFPLMLFSSFFGMNTENTPIVGSRADFWIVVIIMVVVMLSFFAFFKTKKWL